MRADKPIGFLLLFWPTLTALITLNKGQVAIDLLIIFSLGTFFMRSAGCVINDYFDREFDREVQRTKLRPLVTGEVKPYEALILFFFLLVASASLLFFLNLLSLITACMGVVILTIYPLCKRFLKVPQIFLGIAFSWGIIMASTASLGEINLVTFLMFLACFFWILAYDTAYALSDKEDDIRINIHSSAIAFGDHVVPCLLYTSDAADE